ncbi:uncharacterized protein LOC133917844 [Phragmites australis]|uniref:uncharacterized protein LOC133917844 n=1 Tax=Phragmites australis TaxID=29695 RepID=UPI002D7734F3|nr:uncharacterized protein LOC133917844 [Phragmites australis]
MAAGLAGAHGVPGCGSHACGCMFATVDMAAGASALEGNPPPRTSATLNEVEEIGTEDSSSSKDEEKEEEEDEGGATTEGGLDDSIINSENDDDDGIIDWEDLEKSSSSNDDSGAPQSKRPSLT